MTQGGGVARRAGTGGPDRREAAERRRFARALVLLAIAALALRLVYLSGASESPLYRHPALDARVIDETARDLAGGAGESREPYFRPPLYPALLAGVYVAVGHDLHAARVAQAAAGAATVVLLGLLGATLWDRRVGIVAAIVAALYGPSIYFDGELVSASVELFLAALALWLLAEGAKRGSAGWLAGAGFALAAGSITRPTVIPFALLAALWLAWRGIPARATAIYLAAALSLPAAATLRNLAVSGDPVIVASQGGINFYIGNHPGADGTTPHVPGLGSGVTATYEAPFREASRALGRTLRATEVSGYWLAKGLDYWREAPLDATRLTVEKIAMVWNRRELPNTQDQAFFAPYNSWLFRLPLLPAFALLAPIALATAWFARRRAPLLLLFGAVTTAVTAAFFVCDRFRHPLAAAVIPLAAAGLVGAADAWGARRDDPAAWKRRVMRGGTALTVAAVFVWVPFPKWQATETGMSWFRVATAYEQAGDRARAGDAYAKAESAGLATAEFWNNYGLHALRADDLDRAAERFRHAVAADPSHGPALGNLAEVYLRQEEWSLAAGAYAAAAGAIPEKAAELLTNAGVLYRREGKLDAARQAFHDALAARPGFEPAVEGLRAMGEEP